MLYHAPARSDNSVSTDDQVHILVLLSRPRRRRPGARRETNCTRTSLTETTRVALAATPPLHGRICVTSPGAGGTRTARRGKKKPPILRALRRKTQIMPLLSAVREMKGADSTHRDRRTISVRNLRVVTRRTPTPLTPPIRPPTPVTAPRATSPGPANARPGNAPMTGQLRSLLNASLAKAH